MQLEDLAPEILELKDRQEIVQLLYHCLDLADRCDQLDEARECFHR